MTDDAPPADPSPPVPSSPRPTRPAPSKPLPRRVEDAAGRANREPRSRLNLARIISLGALSALIVFLGITFYKVVAPFLLPLFLAGVVAVLCRPWYMRLRRRLNRRGRVAAGVVTAAVLGLILLPTAAATFAAGSYLIDLTEAARTRVAQLKGEMADAAGREDFDYRMLIAADVREALKIEPPAEGEQDLIASAARLLPAEYSELRAAVVQGGRDLPAAAGVGVAAGVLGNAVELLIALAMFGVGLYYFLCDGPALLQGTRELVPVQTEYQQALLDRFDTVLRAVVLSTFLAAAAQGILTAIAIQLCGLGHFVAFAVAGTLSALIPLAGTWLVWGPCVIWLYLHDSPIAATFLLLFGSVVVGTLDNVIRTLVLNSDAKLHPLLAFVCVLGGLKVMGIWGVFVGPVVAACLHTLLEIFNTELREFSRERFDSAVAARRPPEAAPRSAAPPPPTADAHPPLTPSVAAT
ncbi:AI-2E family transporter [Alienimonas sp. DA493]|uniref:AI-2E family transporter n=1 Tax=Alienimonas sp. DA493 TaxID=3373605 RepID=UPI003754D91A